MRIALVDSTPRSTVYPVGLLKIGAMLKANGVKCTLYRDRLPEAGAFDEIWISTLFTFDIPHALGLVREAKKRAARVKVGGIAATLLPGYFEREGVEVHKGLLPEAERFAPDYGLLLKWPLEYSITHTSRGCIRKCRFCMVHRLEPDFVERAHWEHDIVAPRVLFYDNNWLAKGVEGVRRDVAKIRALVRDGKIETVDFNQGLDCRLVTERMADVIAPVPFKPVRFAFDGMQEDGYYQRAVEFMAARGVREIYTYVLYNHMDTPQDFYYRLRESVRLGDELGITVMSFPMRYQPTMEVDRRRGYVGPYWTEQQKKGFMSILQVQSVHGEVYPNSMEHFEYWFGKDGDEFAKLLAYPGVRELARRKKGAMRLAREASKSPNHEGVGNDE